MMECVLYRKSNFFKNIILVILVQFIGIRCISPLSVQAVDQGKCPRYMCDSILEPNPPFINDNIEYALEINDNLTDIKCGSINNKLEVVIDPKRCHILNAKMKFLGLFKTHHYECNTMLLVCERKKENEYLESRLNKLVNLESHFELGEYFKFKSQLGNKKLPGEKCTSSNECYNNDLCLNNICQGKKEKSLCFSSFDCQNGLFCSIVSKKCESQKGLFEKCSTDFECETNAGCLDGICTLYHSIETGSSSRVPDGIFCKNGYSESGKCVVAKKLVSHELNQICSTHESQKDSKCKYIDSNGKFSELGCLCGYTKEGYGFCPLERGDPEYEELMKAKVRLLSKSEYCHTLSRFDYETCNKVREYYKEAEFKSYIFHNHHLIQKNSDCIKETMLTQFYHHKTLISKFFVSCFGLAFSIMLLILVV